MAGLYDLCKITVDTQEYVFRATKGFYVNDIATATGISVATSDADFKLPVMPVKELLKSGVLRTANAIAKLGTKTFRVKLHYTNAKSATVEAAIKDKEIPVVAGKASSGATFTEFSTPLRVTSRS